MARKASTLLALANVASALSAVPRSGLSLTKALAPELLDFGEASSRDAADTKVLNFASPSEIEAAFAGAGVPIGLDGAAGHEDGHLLTACRTALEYSVRTRHPLFLNQLYGGADDAAPGEWLVAACNTNAHTYEVAPVFTLVERAASRIMGLGDDNLVSVPVDAGGRVRGPALKKAMDDARAAGKTPFFVGSTAGTTVRGAFDDLEEVQAVVDECDEPVWHHVDGSWGGAALWSPALKATWLAGVEKADSMAVNPHKLMNAAISRRGLCDESRARRRARGHERRPGVAIKRREADDGALELVMAPHSFTNVLFRVVPKHLRTPRRRGGGGTVARGSRGAGQGAALRQVGHAARRRRAHRLQAYGEAQYGNEEINFFRMVVAQGDLLTTELLDHTLDTMVKHADAFEAH
ncbi:carboxy-lyase [Aureococcus anophagefferens]|nr:carboxy-lyase [Aureococcus anophagefferens]